MNNVDSHLYQLVLQELQNREKIEWVGQPQPGPYAAHSIKILVFAIPWTIFALFWMAAAADFKMPDFKEPADFFPLFGIPFILIGLVLMTRPITDYFKAHKIVYVITNHRAMTLEFGKKKKVKSVDVSNIESIRCVEKQDGSGDLYFSKKPTNPLHDSHEVQRGMFKAIQQVKMAESYLQSQSQQSRTE